MDASLQGCSYYTAGWLACKSIDPDVGYVLAFATDADTGSCADLATALNTAVAEVTRGDEEGEIACFGKVLYVGSSAACSTTSSTLDAIIASWWSGHFKECE